MSVVPDEQNENLKNDKIGRNRFRLCAIEFSDKLSSKQSQPFAVALAQDDLTAQQEWDFKI